MYSSDIEKDVLNDWQLNLEKAFAWQNNSKKTKKKDAKL